MRAALAEVKEVLGPDAVIMSNKKVSGGIEIVAAVDDDDGAPVDGSPAPCPTTMSEFRRRPVSLYRRSVVSSRPTPLQALLSRGKRDPSPKTLAEQVDWGQPEQRREPVLNQPSSLFAGGGKGSRDSRQKESSKDKELNAMRQEIASIRRLLEHQVSGLMWQEVERREPVRAMVIKQLRQLGFSDGFADMLAMRVHESAAPTRPGPRLKRRLTSCW
ncbi:hypothetical protein MBH78_12400 [Oceanimonas sp. NS1]|nr:hypothetical protein [Oceanimonas sp. NS1]